MNRTFEDYYYELFIEPAERARIERRNRKIIIAYLAFFLLAGTVKLVTCLC